MALGPAKWRRSWPCILSEGASPARLSPTCNRLPKGGSQVCQCRGHRSPCKGVGPTRSPRRRSDRTRLELDLLSASAPVLTAIKGYGAPEVERAYARALTLSERLEDDSQMFAVLRGLVAFHQQQGGLLAARRLARRLIALAQRAADPSLLLRAYQALGTTLFYIGERKRTEPRSWSRDLRSRRTRARSSDPPSTAVVCLGMPPGPCGSLAIRTKHSPGVGRRWRSRRSSRNLIASCMVHFCGVIHSFRGEVEAARERRKRWWSGHRAGLRLGGHTGRSCKLDAGRSRQTKEASTSCVSIWCRCGPRVRSWPATFSPCRRGVCEGTLTETDCGLSPRHWRDRRDRERFYEAELHRLRGELLRRGGWTVAPGKQRLSRLRRVFDVPARCSPSAAKSSSCERPPA